MGFYVDDIHFGSQSIQETKNGLNEFFSVLKSDSFEARKFASNCPMVVDDLPKDFIAEGKSQKFKGLLWITSNDCFHTKPFRFEKVPF